MIIDKFKSIFLGLEIAYGQYQPGERGDNGKQKGKAFIVRGQVTDELWSNHLEGKGPALGIIPITENNNCRWAVLILTNIILITLASLKVFGIITSP